MSRSANLRLLATVMVVPICAAAAISLFLLYDAAIEQSRALLLDALHAKTQLVDAAARYDRQAVDSHVEVQESGGTSLLAALMTFEEALVEGARTHSSQETVLAARDRGRIVFLLSSSQFRGERLDPIEVTADLAHPIARALNGQTGTMIGPDYQGRQVLAAYSPVESLGLGVVVKIDMAEIRAPFLKAAITSGLVLLVIVGAGVMVFLRVGKSLFRRLERNERRYRELFELSNDAVLIHDTTGAILDANLRACTMLGFTRNKLISRNLLGLLDPACHNDSVRMLASLSKDRSVHLESTYLRSDGSKIEVEVSASIIDKEEGISQFLVRDITIRKEAEVALKSSEQKYRSLVENLSQGVAVISPEMEVLSMNGMMRRWFPDADPASGHKCYHMFNDIPRDQVCNHCPTVRALNDGRIHEQVTETHMDGETRNFRLVATPILDEDGKVASVIESVEDITEKLRTEQELARADKLESIGVMAGGIAHDFNNMLTAMLGNLSLAQQRLDPTSDLTSLLKSAEKATLQAQTLTKQLLTFSKGGEPVKVLSSVGKIVGEAADFALRGAQISCELECDDDLKAAEMDVGQINQVVGNLVLNASQAMPDGGTVRLRTRNAVIEESEGSSLEPGSYVVISVIDEGTGIPPDVIDKVFDPFFTTKDTGNGLGLASCYSIVQQHGGQIEVTSEVGRGTEFTVFLPASCATVREDEMDRKPIRGSGRILILDDQDSVREMLKAMLEELGYEVETSADGEDTINLYLEAQQSLCSFHAVMLDLTIPGGIGGKEVLVYLKRINPNVRAIVSSGYSNDPIMANHRDYGFSGVIAKPYQLIQLSEVLHSVMGELLMGTGVSERIAAH